PPPHHPPPPPTPTLFPYTTLFRSQAGGHVVIGVPNQHLRVQPRRPVDAAAPAALALVPGQAAEHIANDRLGHDPQPSTACSIQPDRKSTRLNSSHVAISYAVFCLK